VEDEVYVAEMDRLQRNKVQLGTLMPFHGLCVTEALGRQLEQANLRGLLLRPVLFVGESLESAVFIPPEKVHKLLFKLSSSFIAPRTLLPLVNEQGYQVEPNTEWSCYFEDGGYHPFELRYSVKDFELHKDVDIAVSYEKTGVSKARSFRWCIVSQKFRTVMAELKVKGVKYAPVRFES
jgi:hypothetical protein